MPFCKAFKDKDRIDIRPSEHQMSKSDLFRSQVVLYAPKPDGTPDYTAPLDPDEYQHRQVHEDNTWTILLRQRRSFVAVVYPPSPQSWVMW